MICASEITVCHVYYYFNKPVCPFNKIQNQLLLFLHLNPATTQLKNVMWATSGPHDEGGASKKNGASLTLLHMSSALQISDAAGQSGHRLEAQCENMLSIKQPT